MHLVIGAEQFLGRHVSHALASEAPVIELNADADDQTLADAIRTVDVVHICAETWSPGRRLRFRKDPPGLLVRIVNAARRAGAKRIVHISTADVYGAQPARLTERAKLRPTHAIERLKLHEEEWLFDAAQDLDVVVLRPARVFGAGEDWMLPHLLTKLAKGRLWLPGGGRVKQTFVAAGDVGRACLAAADRGQAGHSYLIGGFDSTWRELLESSARVVGIEAEIGSVPYDLAFLRGLAVETMTAPGAQVWPGMYAVDVIGKPHQYDDSYSRRELTWSPAVGSFEQAMPQMAAWLSELPGVAAFARTETT